MKAAPCTGARTATMSPLSPNAAHRAALRRGLEETRRRHRLPAHTRAAAEREDQATREALASVVGGPEADRLVELAGNLPPEEPLAAPPDNAWIRARAMLDTRAGRERLRTLRWDQV